MARPPSGVDVNVRMEGFDRIDFDMPVVRKGLTAAGKLTKAEARRLVARRAISGRGEFPGKQSGMLMRSITTISRGPNWIKIGPTRIAGMDVFYPAFLYYGVTGRDRRKDHKAQPKDGKWRIAPRGNYMAEALRRKRDSVRAVLKAALMDALKPRKF